MLRLRRGLRIVLWLRGRGHIDLLIIVKIIVLNVRIVVCEGEGEGEEEMGDEKNETYMRNL